MYKLGLKLWSINTDYYYDEAIRLYNDGVFDYVELYVVPDTLDRLDKWKKLDIPFIIHAPHYAHELNLADPNKFEYNQKIYKQVERYREELNATYTIIHSGIEGNITEVIRQLNIIKPQDFLIENKPYKAPLGEKKHCRGYNIEEISKVISETKCGFCLDVGHAICTANALNLDPYNYLKMFNELAPKMYHLSDGFENSCTDMHLHFGEGTYDFTKILNILNDNKRISIETNKKSKNNLEDFKEDIVYFKILEDKCQ